MPRSLLPEPKLNSLVPILRFAVLNFVNGWKKIDVTLDKHSGRKPLVWEEGSWDTWSYLKANKNTMCPKCQQCISYFFSVTRNFRNKAVWIGKISVKPDDLLGWQIVIKHKKNCSTCSNKLC